MGEAETPGKVPQFPKSGQNCSFERPQVYSAAASRHGYLISPTWALSDSAQLRFTCSEFGEQCLIEALRQYRELPCERLLTAIVDEVRRFSPDEQRDDITAIVAKGINE
jgi:hypothetical protein